MAKTVKLGGQAKYLTADVGGKKYDIPLADYMLMPDAREMLNIRRLPAKEREGAYTDFFLSYFERLVQTGHLYILETPLFRVRPKGKKDTPKTTRKPASKKKKDAKSEEPEIKPNEQTYYCYSEDERDEKAAVIGKNAEITRIKGLGEISPQEFRQFIDENIRLEQVMIDQTKGIQDMLRFYMGDNTPERWEFIQNNLV